MAQIIASTHEPAARGSWSRGAIILIAFTAIQKLLSAAQQVLVARVFGAGTETDAFFIAQIVPVLAGYLILIALFTTLVPILGGAKLRKKSDFTGLLLALGAAAVGLSVLCAAGAPQIIQSLGPGLSPEAKLIGIRLLRIMSPILAFSTLAGSLTGVLYARSRFVAPAIATCLPYVGGLIGIGFKALYGIDALAYGMLLGAAAHLIVLWVTVRESLFVFPTWHWQLGFSFLRGFPLIFLCTFVTTAYFVVDRVFASQLPSGFVASYTYASNLITVPSQFLVSTCLNAVMPALVAARLSRREFEDIWSHCVGWVFFLLIPVLIAILFCADAITSLLFGSKAFGPRAITMTSGLLQAYVPTVVGSSLREVAAMAFFAVDRQLLPVIVGCSSVALSFALKDALISYWGISAPVFTTDIAALLGGVVLMAVLLYRGSRRCRSNIRAVFGRLGAASAATVAILYF